MTTATLVSLCCASVTPGVLLAGLSLGTLLVAAKTHGRQVRLERERAGYTHVVFGGDNPPPVAALWRRDRIRLWSAAAVVAAAIVGLGVTGRLPVPGAALLWALLVLPLLAGFVVAGLAGTLGFWRRAAIDRRFTRASLPGSLGWWTLLAALVTATARAACCALG